MSTFENEQDRTGNVILKNRDDIGECITRVWIGWVETEEELVVD